VVTIRLPEDAAAQAHSLLGAKAKSEMEVKLSDVLGRKTTVRFETDAALTSTTPPEETPEPESKPQPPPDPMQQLRDDPLIRSALEMFKAELV
jgi:hypothetical protein